MLRIFLTLTTNSENKMLEKTKCHIITYGNSRYSSHFGDWKNNAKNSSFDSYKLYNGRNVRDIKDFKYNLNSNEDFKKVFNSKIGGGYWIWKPFIINDFLSKINYGDLLIYCDLRFQPNSDIEPDQFLKLKNKTAETSHGILIPRYDIKQKFHVARIGGFSTTLNKFWNHSKVFEIFNLKNELEVRNKPQIWATIHCIIKSKKTEFIYRKFKRIAAKHPLLFTSMKKQNKDIDKDLICCRHDQSIWNLLCEEHFIEPFIMHNPSDICKDYFNVIKFSNNKKPQRKK